MLRWMPGAEVRIALHPGGFPHDHALETTLSDFPVSFPLPLVEAICDVMQARFVPCDQPGSTQPPKGVMLPKGMLTGFDRVMVSKECEDVPRDEFIAKAPRPRRQSELQQRVRASDRSDDLPRVIASFVRHVEPEAPDNPKRVRRGSADRRSMR